MARIALRDFSKYLSLNLPADEIPANALRRARGVHPVKTNSCRSRPGSTLVNSSPASSMIMFRGTLHQSTSALSYLSFPPTSSIKDWLFISNGATLTKVDPAGTSTQWGITPPPDGFTATLATSYTKLVWTAPTQLTVIPGTSGVDTHVTTLDLSTFTVGGASTDADYISFSIAITEPDNLSSIELQFSLHDTTFAVDTLSYVLDYNSNSSQPSTVNGVNTVYGLGGTDNYATPEQEEQTQRMWPTAILGDNPYATDDVRDTLAQTALPLSSTNVWTPIKIAKSQFTRSGTGAYTWADIKSTKIIVKATNAVVTVYFSDINMVGGNGMQGDYTYYVTYFNINSGTRSNPNPTPVTLTGNMRQKVNLANLPVPSDTQVTHVEIWRTVGGGAVPFYCARVVAGVTTYVDTVSDAYPLYPVSTALLLSSTKINFYNIVPASTFGYCEGWQAAVFWTNTDEDNRGNLYYSRTGYAESNEGFIRVSTSNDPLIKPVLWNGTLYVFSQGKLFQVWGTNPYYSREVYGVPGTPYAETIRPTPYGIMYQSLDGIRLFNGTRSERVGWPQIGRLCSGEDVENLTSFIGTCATWGRNEYLISDGTQTLAHHVTDDTWRDIGLGFTCLYTDPLTKNVYGGNATGVYLLDQPGVYTDDNIAIPFEIQPKQVRMDVDREVMVNHLFLDADTQGQALTITLITEKGDISVGVLNTASRQTVVIPIGQPYQRLGIRLAGSLLAPVEIFGIEVNADIEQSMLQDKYFKNLLAM